MPASRRRVAHALFEYTDADGVSRIALFGQEVTLTPAELKRGERLGALSKDAEPVTVVVEPSPDNVPASSAQPAEPGADPEAPPASSDAEPAQPEPKEPEPSTSERPAQVAPKAAWVDYAVTQGMTREDADAATKAELVERFGG